jgi:ABC-type bacteriocin/lantibiotic exporter with double-glycine peptidase domain
MSRSKAKIHPQPDDYTCGPASLKTALEILGVKSSLKNLIRLCRTNKNGTKVIHLVKAANKLGVSALVLEWATLRHLQSALKNTSTKPKSVIVDYLYKDEEPHYETGHYAAVASFSASVGRIQLFDSISNTKKTYAWKDFLDRWYDYEKKWTHVNHHRQKFRLTRKWSNRLMIILTKDPKFLPKFKISSQKIYPA